MSNVFPIKNGLKSGDVLSPLLFHFALGYTIRRVPINLGDMKLSGTHQLLVSADDVIILVGSVHYYCYWYSALGPVWAETRVQSGDWYGSGTLHPGQILRGSLPLLSPAF